MKNSLDAICRLRHAQFNSKSDGTAVLSFVARFEGTKIICYEEYYQMICQWKDKLVGGGMLTSVGTVPRSTDQSTILTILHEATRFFQGQHQQQQQQKSQNKTKTSKRKSYTQQQQDQNQSAVQQHPLSEEAPYWQPFICHVTGDAVILMPIGADGLVHSQEMIYCN